MTWIDCAVLAIIGISVIVSVLRGLVREVLALASWIAAFLAARFFAPAVAPWFSRTIPDETLRLLTAYAAVFVMTLLAAALLSMLISHLIKAAGLGAFDRVLGAGFGFVRGVAIVVLATLLAGLTALPRQPAWRDSWSGARLAALGTAAKAWLPYDLARRIHYD
ncbi:MAG TPA: CvpA family protein [Burkholderiales bacterium]|nr:CvpA family protein [Burkholderiales bacterium]